MLTAAGALAGAHVFKMSPALPALRDELSIGLVAGGWLFSLVNLVTLILGIMAGTFSDRIGHRRVILTGIVVMGLASLAGSFVHDLLLLLITHLAEGIGFLAVVIAAPSLITGEAQRGDRGLALGIWSAYLPAGAALVVLVAPFIMGLAGWRGLWQVTAALSVLLFVFIQRAKPRSSNSQHSGAVSSMAANVVRTISRRGPWLPALGFGLYTLQFTALMSWLPSYMVENRDLPPALAGMLTALVIAVNIPGCLFGGFLLKKGWRHGSLVALTSGLMATMGLIIFSSAMPDMARYLACIGLSLAGGMIPASVLGAAPLMAPSPAQIGTTNGLIVQGSNIGNVLGPPLLAAATTIRGRWEDAIWMFLAAAALNIVLSQVLRKEEVRREAA
jgi:MFS family permease